MNFNLVGDFEQCVLERKEDVIVNDKMSGLIECTNQEQQQWIRQQQSSVRNPLCYTTMICNINQNDPNQKFSDKKAQQQGKLFNGLGTPQNEHFNCSSCSPTFTTLMHQGFTAAARPPPQNQATLLTLCKQAKTVVVQGLKNCT